MGASPVRHYRLRKGGELYALATKLNDFLDDLLYSAFAAVKDRADLYASRFMVVISSPLGLKC
jgi:hypothetical protein